eukprot:gene3346-2328_t
MRIVPPVNLQHPSTQNLICKHNNYACTHAIAKIYTNNRMVTLCAKTFYNKIIGYCNSTSIQTPATHHIHLIHNHYQPITKVQQNQLLLTIECAKHPNKQIKLKRNTKLLNTSFSAQTYHS